jgi:hypothetical protein
MKRQHNKPKQIKSGTVIGIIFALFALYVVVDSAGIQIPVWLLVIIALIVGALVRMQADE